MIVVPDYGAGGVSTVTGIPIGGIDHVAFPVTDLERMLAFLSRVLGATPAGPALVEKQRILVQQMRVGSAVLSVHSPRNGLDLVAKGASPGSLDVCFRWEGSIADAAEHLRRCSVDIEEGPARRRTACGQPSQSIYFRDPDGNLFELMATDECPEPASKRSISEGIR